MSIVYYCCVGRDDDQPSTGVAEHAKALRAHLRRHHPDWPRVDVYADADAYGSACAAGGIRSARSRGRR